MNRLTETLREVDTFRREATAALSVVDRMDYEDELDEIQEPQEQEGEDGIARDTQSARMIIAARHGSTRVRQMIDQLSPGFDVFAGCDLDRSAHAPGTDHDDHGPVGGGSGDETPATAPAGSTFPASADVRTSSGGGTGIARKRRLKAGSRYGRVILARITQDAWGGFESRPYCWPLITSFCGVNFW